MGRTMIHSRSLSRRRFSCASFSAYSSLSSGGTSTFMKNAPANPGSCLLSPTPHAVWHTKRRKPCSFIAEMMLAEPAETGPCGSPGLRGWSGLLGWREPRTHITASLPATASRTFSASKASPTTTLSRLWRAVSFAGFLTKAVTSCPSAIALSTRRRPVPPVGPKITTLMPALPVVSRRRLPPVSVPNSPQDPTYDRQQSLGGTSTYLPSGLISLTPLASDVEEGRVGYCHNGHHAALDRV